MSGNYGNGPVYKLLQDPESTMSVLAAKACSEDSSDLLDQAMSLVTDQSEIARLRHHILRCSIRENATSVLTRLIQEYGEDVTRLNPVIAAGAGKVSTETLSTLLGHGWDINHHIKPCSSLDRHPFLWHVTKDLNLVAWCLENGAKVHPQDLEPVRFDQINSTNTRFRYLLERCAETGSVQSFELLRSRGAPPGWRPLHLAVQTATYSAPDYTKGSNPIVEENVRANSGSQRRKIYKERMIMVRHLVDVVHCDVNALDKPVGSPVLPFRHGTPLCYVSGSGRIETDVREIAWFLLDRGADPVPALREAELSQHPTFAEAVAEWNSNQVSQVESASKLRKAASSIARSLKCCRVQ